MQILMKPTSDVLVIGGGTAALGAAVSASQSGASVTILRKGSPNLGIVAMCAVVPGTDDTVEKFFNDTMTCGKFMADPGLAAITDLRGFQGSRIF